MVRNTINSDSISIRAMPPKLIKADSASSFLHDVEHLWLRYHDWRQQAETAESAA